MTRIPQRTREPLRAMRLPVATPARNAAAPSPGPDLASAARLAANPLAVTGKRPPTASTDTPQPRDSGQRAGDRSGSSLRTGTPFPQAPPQSRAGALPHRTSPLRAHTNPTQTNPTPTNPTPPRAAPPASGTAPPATTGAAVPRPALAPVPLAATVPPAPAAPSPPGLSSAGNAAPDVPPAPRAPAPSSQPASLPDARRAAKGTNQRWPAPRPPALGVSASAHRDAYAPAARAQSQRAPSRALLDSLQQLTRTSESLTGRLESGAARLLRALNTPEQVTRLRSGAGSLLFPASRASRNRPLLSTARFRPSRRVTCSGVLSAFSSRAAPLSSRPDRDSDVLVNCCRLSSSALEGAR